MVGSHAPTSVLRRFAAFAGLVAAAAASAGCGDGADACAVALDWGRGGEYMLPGTDCGECHREGGSAADAIYAISGTVFAEPDCPMPVADVIVRVLDGAGTMATMVTNGAGNFFTDQRLVSPFTVAVEVDGVVGTMPYALDNGSCGRCHAPDSELGLVWAGE